MKSKKLALIKTNHLSEIFQSLDMKFAWLNDNYKQVTVPAKCRDFLGDCVWSRRTGNEVSIYGFQYNYKKNPYSTKHTLMSVKFPNQESYDYFLCNSNQLQEKEKYYGLKPMEIITTDQPLTLIIRASNYWSQTSWKISLLTFFIKRLSYKNVTCLQEPENEYNSKLTVETEQAFWHKIKSKKDADFGTIYEAHNNSGFVSIIEKNRNKQMTKFIFGGN